MLIVMKSAFYCFCCQWLLVQYKWLMIDNYTSTTSTRLFRVKGIYKYCSYICHIYDQYCYLTMTICNWISACYIQSSQYRILYLFFLEKICLNTMCLLVVNLLGYGHRIPCSKHMCIGVFTPVSMVF